MEGYSDVDYSGVEYALRRASEAAEEVWQRADGYPLSPGEKERVLEALSETLGRRGGHDGERSRLDAVFDGDMDEVRRAAERRGVTVEEVSRAHGALVESPGRLTPHSDVIDRTGASYHEARHACAVLSDVGDVHECYDEEWNLHWVQCDEFIREKCEQRRISLCRYFKMHDILHEFQDEVIGWYVRRNRRQQQPFNLRAKKEEYTNRIQREYFPDKPVGDEWSRHIAARYIRTAQDSIIRSMDLTY